MPLGVILVDVRMVGWRLGDAWSQGMDGPQPEVDLTPPSLFVLVAVQWLGLGFLMGRRLRVWPRWRALPLPLVLTWVGVGLSSSWFWGRRQVSALCG